MSKKAPKWQVNALSNLEFFYSNPEYKNEFGHDYIAERCGVTRMTLSRNQAYMQRYREVREYLKGFKRVDPAQGATPINGYKEKYEAEVKKTSELETKLNALILRLNDCYQMLEDQGIDPEFIYPRKLKKHKEN
ncbi:hypothetical protein [Vibrio vulnificus]|uniref:hypothetical protein n=1 Tax=Vibrio vulnificus TaxID=672 RepID=UPI003EDA49EB